MEDFKTKEFTMLTPFSVVTKEVDVADLTGDSVIKIAGYANWAGNDEYGKTYVDLVGDVVVPSGVDTSVWAINPQILWQHDREETIGVGVLLEKRQDGIYIEAIIHKDAMEEKQWHRIKSGLVKMFSVGFRTLDGHYKEVDGQDVFYITKALLLEVSIVSIPANSKSGFSIIKSLGEGFTSDFVKEDNSVPSEVQTITEEETYMTNIKVKRADLLSEADLERFKSLGGNVEEDVEVSLSDFVKGIVAQEVAAITAAKEKEAQEAAEKAAQELVEKEAAEAAEKAAQDAEAARLAEETAQLEAKELEDEVEQLKSLVANLKSTLFVDEK